MVDTIALDQAVGLVEREHYANGAANTATFRHGLYRRDEWPFTYRGCALWIPPTRTAAEATMRQLNRTVEDWQSVLALSRLAIEPGVPTNGASFLLGASTRKISDEPRWHVLVTYADEWQGHTGAIYRASGWIYLGLTKPERVYVIDGVMTARKAGPVTRTHDQMVALGAECIGSFARHKFAKVLR